MNAEDREILHPYIQYFNLIESDLCIADKNGVIIYISPGYANRHNLKEDEFLGTSSSELEQNNIFVPSITEVCLQKKKRVTLVQTNPRGNSILSTATPIFDKTGKIQYVLSYNSLDIADCYYGNYKFDAATSILNTYIRNMRAQNLQESHLNTRSAAMKNIIDVIERIADTPATVLITGDTGVGKTLIARHIHEKSKRKTMPFVDINCGAIPPSLIESELFGYAPGAFTNALPKGKKGQIEVADKGTLFLDEISEMHLDMQAKFLKAIQEKKITRIGSVTPVSVDFRLIAATNRNLDEAIERGEFREDLFYRLNVIPIHIPSLDERPEDIEPLVNHFLDIYNKLYSKNIALTPDSIKLLEEMHWPGNIRELENYIERLIILSQTEIITPSMLNEPAGFSTESDAQQENESAYTLKERLENYEKQIIRDAYNKYASSTLVAEHLGISQTTAFRKLKKYIPDYSENNPE